MLRKLSSWTRWSGFVVEVMLWRVWQRSKRIRAICAPNIWWKDGYLPHNSTEVTPSSCGRGYSRFLHAEQEWSSSSCWSYCVSPLHIHPSRYKRSANATPGSCLYSEKVLGAMLFSLLILKTASPTSHPWTFKMIKACLRLCIILRLHQSVGLMKGYLSLNLARKPYSNTSGVNLSWKSNELQVCGRNFTNLCHLKSRIATPMLFVGNWKL